MHRKRVTSELYDSYFRLMTIKHAIPKIEWVLNYYITQSRQKSERDSWSKRRDVVGKPHQVKEVFGGPRLSSPGEWERHNADSHRSGGQYTAVLFGLQLPLTVKPWITFSNTFNKMRGTYFSKRLLKVLLWEGVGDRTELQYIDPHSYGRQRCVFLILQGCSTGGPGAHSAGFLYYILSATSLDPNSSGPQASPRRASLPHLVF